jgi:fatty-acyl-CoA synthase
VAVFGQTEMSPVTCALSGEDAVRKIGSVGKPVSIVAARIVDDDMKDVRPARWRDRLPRPVGHGRVLQNPGHGRRVPRRLVPPGDLVRADEEGFLFVVDGRRT